MHLLYHSDQTSKDVDLHFLILSFMKNTCFDTCVGLGGAYVSKSARAHLVGSGSLVMRVMELLHIGSSPRSSLRIVKGGGGAHIHTLAVAATTKIAEARAGLIADALVLGARARAAETA